MNKGPTEDQQQQFLMGKDLHNWWQINGKMSSIFDTVKGNVSYAD
jgi:hypothetical protein